ncbi:MAG: glycosyltransferase 87 family protein, partial [Anaerolineales bacterium]
DTVYTLLGLLLWMFGLLKRKEITAGLGLALATLSPTIAGALALPLFASRRRAGIWFVIGMLLLTLHAFLLLGIQGIKDFIYLLGINAKAQAYGLDWSNMYNLIGLLIRSFPNADQALIRGIAWSAAGISIFAMCIWWWKKGEEINIKHISIAVLLGTFTAPHLYLHGLSYLLLPLLGIMVLLYEAGKQTIALLLAPIISTLLIIILLLIPNWDFNIYYLLMLVLFLGFLFVRNETVNSIEDNKL